MTAIRRAQDSESGSATGDKTVIQGDTAGITTMHGASSEEELYSHETDTLAHRKRNLGDAVTTTYLA